MASVAQQIHTAYHPQPDNGSIIEDYGLLLRFLKRALTPTANVSFASSSIRWPSLLALARHHQVVPLLRVGLQDISGIPAAVEQSLDTYCRTVVAHNLSLASELTGLLHLFEAAQLRAVPFKGPAWTNLLYGNLALRQIADLDIFIEKQQARQAFYLVLARGYIFSGKWKGVSPEQIRLDDKGIEMTHPRTGIQVELHWRLRILFRPPIFRVESLATCFTTTLLGRQMPLPSPENIFFSLPFTAFVTVGSP